MGEEGSCSSLISKNFKILFILGFTDRKCENWSLQIESRRIRVSQIESLRTGVYR